MYLGLGTYSLGTYSLAQPMLDLATYSLRWLGAELQRILILMYLDLVTWSLGTYNLEQPILDLATHSLHCNLQPEDLQSKNLQSRATDFGSRNALIALEPTV